MPGPAQFQNYPDRHDSGTAGAGWIRVYDDAGGVKTCALNVKVMKFKQARVNGGSNYDSLKVAKCLVI
ncbi:hypothetical protein Pmar_PMAR009452 [Perkinsus marinus ATCC 50983]|uniref:Uncharacterized protein n=1 Tax=Perkinsus marinus (strain ATCC 50983 / TXsc) TaxID=423536 RepID=C5LRM8_PERM5|nr:hypothetical protein Pmar_PMAR009452 [Perkinsus marinus ATCC 50983]EER00615.1 hypothetical protein Pmar_PMAR009452 [Perkinsus marinus ATCC 50983]|eukprot:XP_002767897.1 hypothetical protein Pmar_PMAR009452 [Perkinsus marinus ATCC 50983]